MKKTEDTKPKAPSKQNYTVLKAFEYQHQPLAKDDTIDLFPKQANYLVTGGFLALSQKSKSTSTAKG